MLAKAYQRFLSEICQQCGLPRYVCHSDDNRIQFRVATDECAASAVAEREQARIAKDDRIKNYGSRVYADPYLTEDAVSDGMELSDFRRPYLIDRARKMGLIPDVDDNAVSGGSV